MPERKRSGFEQRVATALTKRGVKYQYEPCSFVYYKKPYNPTCADCGSTEVYSCHSYTPDFYLPEYGFYIETKGKFTAADRTKMKAVIEANPDLDIRMVFMTDNKLTKKSKKRYSDWASDSGIMYSVGVEVPDEWF